MTPEWIISRFDRKQHQPRKYSDTCDDFTAFRGDHNLNLDMSPKFRVDGSLKPAAVLVPIVKRSEGLTVLFTRRTEHLTHHPGQVSFPGGRTEEVDKSPEHTALRETEEELGVPAEYIHIFGHLDDYITRTGFMVTPVVGIVDPSFPLKPDPSEVADVFEVPLSFLLNPDNHARHSRMFEGSERYFYAMPYNDYFIWGATAGMLINLYQVLS
ncbi:CoA pyrophosphatase [Motiliproteus sp. MSK22-1]|uniref:CoA pyrophosphatase n=1 Tax=Motiliproteus sp. MSK22-1 TaxID=1897630 RepID=UPI0009787D0A|nr:CoA pyrophosphatase [Motiliproteus sp. MSK22-1]OMH39775.1 hypothetical protein BGP75_01600 [Motiliproteus sp. MSK22-1]